MIHRYAVGDSRAADHHPRRAYAIAARRRQHLVERMPRALALVLRPWWCRGLLGMLTVTWRLKPRSS